MTTEVDIPTFVAYVAPTPGKTAFYGAGASLSPYYAAYRAITELLQSYLLKLDLPPTVNLLNDLEPLRKYPSLHRCGYFDLGELLPHALSVPFNDRSVPTGPDAHLQEMIHRVNAAGFSIY